MRVLFCFCWCLFALSSCKSSIDTLPFLGQKTTNSKGDSVNHTIENFSFINQDGDTLKEDFVKNKIYVADFFFTSCPTICPVMKTQLLRVYEKYNANNNFKILSHTIDPGHDSVKVLHKYRQKLGIKGNNWQFVTGEQQQIYDIAQKSYMVSALEDKEAIDEGGFVHSGAFVLVDKNRNIRGIYDGTKSDQVDKLINDIEILLK
jgi:protein SCO1